MSGAGIRTGERRESERGCEEEWGREARARVGRGLGLEQRWVAREVGLGSGVWVEGSSGRGSSEARERSGGHGEAGTGERGG